ncbi:MAG: glycosyltransferase family 2 protein, partial [Actinomycetota bacterium]
MVAVVVAHDGALWLTRTLAAIAEQSREVDAVVGVDTGSRDGSADLLRQHLGAGQVVEVGRRTGFGAAVRAGLEHLQGAPTDADEIPGADWIWLLHDDSAAGPGALEHLLDAAAASSQVGVVGPKLVAWDDPTRLLEAGLTVSRGGRRVTGIADDERDQGQHDHRTDVLAVGTAGMLVDRALWDLLGGLDPALPLLRDDIDLCWRAHLAGRRVVLAPRAVVADAQAATRGLREVDAVRAPLRRVDRRASLQVALARCSWPALPILWAWLLVGGVARSLALLLAKAPRRAADELLVTLAVTATPWTWLGSRWRARGTRRVRR